MHPTHIPLRVATGAFILNSGIGKLKAGEEEAEQMHGWASSVYPVFKDMKAGDFTKALAYAEIGLGAALLLPTVPSAVAGAGLAAFGVGLTGLYLKTPGMTQEDGIRPTPDGIGLAKDVWLVGAGLTLATQSFLSGTKHAAQSVADGVGNAAGAVAGGVTGAAGAAAAGVTGAASSVGHGLADAVGVSGKGKAKGTLKGLSKGAHTAREDLSEALADLADSLLGKR
ncbi:hypothetical protein BJF86_10770 [Serinicoccus sp. CNJ-927]|uniref:hypothetical protein n=1 Tax=unclassified Serinicoccus TaxID=2643101 RepID=UPI00095CC639|nr:MULTISPECIES: hypothetical protein [unclassified Serinicoccus]OLT15597.1 hypothetical protein BJF80_09350 [Serinicoccus sp. CUA-874]OLT44914.1 hypothetical protein BJF86_10770 [Serinicoccus sp. CNJ-927]